MADKPKKLTHGYDSGKSSDKGLSPQKPYTGDGHITRNPHDPVKLDKKDK